MKKYISTFVYCYIIWVLLAGFDLAELLAGAVVSLVLAFFLRNIVNMKIGWKAPVKLILFIILYIPVFIYELVKSNLDVMRKVLNPRLPIKPGFVKVHTDLKSGLGKLILANSITLTPGTIAVDADDDSIYVHWIEVKGENSAEYSKKIAGKFEKILKKVLS